METTDVKVKLAPHMVNIPVGTPLQVKDGMVWLAPIEDILRVESCDGAEPDDSIVTAEDANAWVPGDDDAHYYDTNWRQLLRRKRNDSDYWMVRESLAQHGFVRPLTADVASHNEQGFTFGDGHHRLAAAIELGFTHVPLEAYESYNISDDSGCWDGRIDSAIGRNPRHDGSEDY